MPVEVKIVDNLGRGKTCGTCQPIFDKGDKLEKIKIQIKFYPATTGMIECLAHEMVHAQQWIQGRLTLKTEKVHLILGLIPITNYRLLWKGSDISDTPYYEKPSEVEAHLMQRQMTKAFLEYMGDTVKADTMAGLFEKILDSEDE